MQKKFKKLLAVPVILFTSMHFSNKYIESSNLPVTKTKDEKTFYWKDMKINYVEKGNQSAPILLLLHNLYPSASKEEWNKIDDLLSKNYHIYELDLPGCGKSEKPNITYINYMFVQILSEFIKDVIKERTSICSTGFSSSITLMTARMHPDIIDKIIIINPTSIHDLVKPAAQKEKVKEKIINLPVIGTFFYNCLFSKSEIEDDYKYLYFYNKKNVLSRDIDISYYNAHFDHSNGKYLLGSIFGNYTNINIIHALPMIKNEIYMIGNKKQKEIINEYKKYQDSIHPIYVSNCRLLPQLEIPETIIDTINQIILK